MYLEQLFIMEASNNTGLLPRESPHILFITTEQELRERCVAFLLTYTVGNEWRGTGVAQGLQQQDTHPVPNDGGQGLGHRALSRLVESEPNGQDGGFQRVVGVKQGGAQVIQHRH